jgi:hypothetical protein
MPRENSPYPDVPTPNSGCEGAFEVSHADGSLNIQSI